MPQSIISFNYSEANILGWLFAQQAELPSYSSLLEISKLSTLAEREQALRTWSIFSRVDNFDSIDWVKQFLDDVYDELQIALPTRYGMDNHSYITDVVWLERWMSAIRLLFREQFIEKKTKTDREFIIDSFTLLLSEIPIPTDLQTVFLLSFDEALKQPLTLVSLEFALDRAQLGVQIRHLETVKSESIQQWIMLRASLTWVQQYARAISLEIPEPVWSEWFPPEVTPKEFQNFESLRDNLLRRLTGGNEWVLPLELLDIDNAVSTDSVILERKIKSTLSAYLNQSLYSDDIYLKIMIYVYKIRLLAETAAVIMLPDVLSFQEVAEVTANFDN